MMETTPTILLVEDNDDDVFIMKNALEKAGIRISVQVVQDGQVAIDYLAGTGIFADRARFPLPFLVFLDLKLPYVQGFEVLSWISAQETLKQIVVVVLTGSSQEKDQRRAYELGARSYLVKPPAAAALLDIFSSLKSYWLSKPNTAPLASIPGSPTID